MYARPEGDSELSRAVAELGALPTEVSATALADVAGTLTTMSEDAGASAQAQIIRAVGERAGAADAFSYVLEALGAGATAVHAALEAQQTDIDSVLFVLLLMLVLVSLMTGRTVVSAPGSAPTAPLALGSAPTRPLPIPSPAVLGVAAVVPELMREALAQLDDVLPAISGYDTLAGVGIDPDPESFGAQIQSHSRRRAVDSAVRDTVAAECGLAPDDPMVDRIIALV